MASIWEKAISIVDGNLNSGRGYLITAVPAPKEVNLLPICNQTSKRNIIIYAFKDKMSMNSTSDPISSFFLIKTMDMNTKSKTKSNVQPFVENIRNLHEETSQISFFFDVTFHSSS